MPPPPHRSSHNTPHATAFAHADPDAACISEIVGEADCAKFGRGIVYCALRNIVCTGCGAPVHEGELFTRWQFRRATNLFGDPNIAPPRLAARCRACVPFAADAIDSRSTEPSTESTIKSEDDPDVQTSSHRSPLIAHLLEGAGATKVSTANENATIKSSQQPPDATSSHEAAHEESYRRLAPALNANRRTISRSGAFRKTVPVKRKF